MRKRIPGSLANVIGLVIAWVVIFCLVSYFSPSFATSRNIELLARQTTIVSMAALGMTYIIISGGIDLSVGSVVALVTVVIAWMLKAGYHSTTALVVGIAAGTFCGIFNGLLVTRLKVGPFIVTLGTLLIVRGFAKGLAHEQKIDAPMTWLANLLEVLGPGDRWRLLPYGVWAMLVFSVVAAWVLRYTKFGRYVVAIGSNEQAARLCGVPVESVKLKVFALGGLFAGFAGLMQYSRLTVGDPTVAVGLELDVIAAVVIGGASLAGGEGSILGSLLGALIMTTIGAGGSQMGLPNWVQEIVTGSIIVISVALDRLRLKKV